MDARGQAVQSVSFVIPSLPPSVNAIYQIIFSQRRVEMKPEVRLWKTQAKVYVPRIVAHGDVYTFKIDTVFHYPWHHKNGKLRKFDSQNLLKVLCDAIAEKTGFSDERFKAGSWDSVDDESQKVDVTVSQVGA